jgi:hypothetical protein
VSDLVATAVAATAFSALLVVLVVRGLTRARGRRPAWSTWGAVPVALAGLLGVARVEEGTVLAWTALCFGLYAAWATGQVVLVARSRTPDRGRPRYAELAAVSAACLTIALFPLIAD